MTASRNDPGPPYPLRVKRTRTGIEVRAVGYIGRDRIAWIEFWGSHGGWVAQEMADSSGGMIAVELPTREDAIDAACDFVRRSGGTARIDFKPYMATGAELR